MYSIITHKLDNLEKPEYNHLCSGKGCSQNRISIPSATELTCWGFCLPQATPFPRHQTNFSGKGISPNV